VTCVIYAVEGWGVGEAWFDERGRLLQHELPRLREHPDPGNGDGIEPNVERLVHRLAAYFAGADDDFADVELDLDWCTPFQRAVTDALRAVPRGEVVTYGELAALAGRPNAQRAVGTYCAHNRFGLVVPCHRVVAAAGIGSYGETGVAYKRRLLELEGVGAANLRGSGGQDVRRTSLVPSAKPDA
jgi:O-6-methylguanine DNA methyltransferase